MGTALQYFVLQNYKTAKKNFKYFICEIKNDVESFEFSSDAISDEKNYNLTNLFSVCDGNYSERNGNCRVLQVFD